MKWLSIATSIIFSLGVIVVIAEKLFFSRLKDKYNETDIQKENGEICVLCGAYMPSESGKQYCKECERKYNDSYEV